MTDNLNINLKAREFQELLPLKSFGLPKPKCTHKLNLLHFSCNCTKHQLLARHFYLLINASTCFGFNCWPSAGSFLLHVQLMFLMLLKHKLHMLKILPEDGQQLRSKHMGSLINKIVLRCTHACTLPRPCLKTMQRKTHRKKKNAPDVSLDATLFNAI
jgi:hypothetical protein